MKRRWSFRLALVMLFAMLMQMTVCAAGNATVTINSCTIAGNTVTVVLPEQYRRQMMVSIICSS